jgi:hypothetical protein
MSPRGARVLALAFAALALTACGRKGAPIAPERRLPAPIADLTAVIRESTVELAWTNPTRRVDRTLIRDLALARVYRVEDDGRGEPKAAMLADGAVAGYTEIAAIRLDAPEPAAVQGTRVTLADRGGLAYARRYTYVVVTADSLGRVSPPSRRVSVGYVAAAEPPASLTAQPGQREARLAWQPPARLLDGSPPGPLVYDILRAPAADAPLVPVAGAPAGARAQTDRELENDRTYYSAVRAVRVEGGTTAYGALSARVAVTPRKTTPPTPPADLVGIPSEGAVRLSWKPSPDGDVSGYVVYRAAPGGAFVRIGATEPPATTFVDRDVARGAWRYAVTAEDSATIRNESARSNEVTVAVP